MSKTAKKSARERLLEHVSDYVRAFQRGKSFATLDARTRRLLREHERELAERGRAQADKEIGYWYEREERRAAAVERVRAAILKRSAAPKAHGTRGKRGAK